MIINEAMVRREFPNEDPLGKQMLIGYSNQKGPTIPRTIVGVVKDMRITSVRGEAEAQYFVPFAQIPFSSVSVTLRTAGDPGLLASALRNEMKNLDPDLALFNVRPLRRRWFPPPSPRPRFNATLLGDIRRQSRCCWLRWESME